MNNTILTVRIALYFIFFICPILGMMNCGGWNEGSMKVSSCYIDGEFVRAYAELFYGLLLVSAFTLFLPFAIYAGISIGITELVVEIVKYKSANKGLAFKSISVLTVILIIFFVFVIK